jgi:hypothetical protein
MKYKYTLTEDKVYIDVVSKEINFKGYSDKGELLVDIREGNVIVKAGYAWDGCSVKLFRIGKLYIGTPDGFHNETKWASCIHDVLYQFNKGINSEKVLITRLDVDNLFRDQLIKAEWRMTNLYYKVVRSRLGQEFWDR